LATAVVQDRDLEVAPGGLAGVAEQPVVLVETVEDGVRDIECYLRGQHFRERNFGHRFVSRVAVERTFYCIVGARTSSRRRPGPMLSACRPRLMVRLRTRSMIPAVAGMTVHAVRVR
jgi:hypothetical protein